VPGELFSWLFFDFSPVSRFIHKMKILDLTAGRRAVWYDKKHPLCTYLDIRPEVEPDILCDTTALPDEVGRDYDLIVYDPPPHELWANFRHECPLWILDNKTNFKHGFFNLKRGGASQ
jgi:hypothetical protein